MNLEVPPSVLPSLTKLRNIPEGEEKWDCSAQTTETLPHLSVPPNGVQNKRNRSEQSSIEGDDQRPKKKVRNDESIDEEKKDETDPKSGRKSRRKKRGREEEKTKDSRNESPLCT
jgi:hypothetical protein